MTTTWRALPVKRWNTRSESRGQARAGHAPPPTSSSASDYRQGRLRGLDVHDLVLQGAARSGDLDDLALLLAHDRLADGRFVGELVLGRIRLRGADDVVLDRLLRVQVAQAHLRAHGDDAL